MTEVGTVNHAITGIGSLEARAARGAAWSMIGFVAGQALRFVGNIVLTRLLFEETFGLMLLVQAFLAGIHLFSDFGIGSSIIQNKRGNDPVFVNTAFTMQAGRGLILWMITWAGALPFAAFYDEPILAWILPIAGFTALLDGLCSTKLIDSPVKGLDLYRLFWAQHPDAQQALQAWYRDAKRVTWKMPGDIRKDEVWEMN